LKNECSTGLSFILNLLFSILNPVSCAWYPAAVV
jgi:hypothetical protein